MPLETSSTETTGTPETDSKRADALPSVPFSDEDWRERIARAKQAREEGRKARRGKPLTFRTNGCSRHGTRLARRAARPKKRLRMLSRGAASARPPRRRQRPAPYRTPCGRRLTTIVCTSNSSVSTNAARPSGPNAMGIAATPSAKVPA